MDMRAILRVIAASAMKEVSLHEPKDEVDLNLDKVVGTVPEDLRWVYSLAKHADGQRMRDGERLLSKYSEGVPKGQTEIEHTMVKATYFKALPEFLQEAFWYGVRYDLDFWQDGFVAIRKDWKITWRKQAPQHLI